MLYNIFLLMEFIMFPAYFNLIEFQRAFNTLQGSALYNFFGTQTQAGLSRFLSARIGNKPEKISWKEYILSIAPISVISAVPSEVITPVVPKLPKISELDNIQLYKTLLGMPNLSAKELADYTERLSLVSSGGYLNEVWIKKDKDNLAYLYKKLV